MITISRSLWKITKKIFECDSMRYLQCIGIGEFMSLKSNHNIVNSNSVQLKSFRKYMILSLKSIPLGF